MNTRQSPPAAGHDWAAELLSALLDGELDETTAAAVTAHRQECAECSRDWAELRATKQLLAALPAAQAPRSYAILADDLAEPDRAGTPFWPRLLGLTWRLSGAVAVVIILIGTVQLAGIGLGEEAETQYSQAAQGRPPGQLGASERPAARQAAAPAGQRGERAAAGAAGAADAASQAIVVERGKPVVVEKVVEKAVTVEKAVVVEKVVEKQVVAADAARAPAPAAARTATPTVSPTATTPPIATPAPPTAVPTPAPAAMTAPPGEPAGPTFAPGVLWLIGGAVVVVVAGAAWLGERWIRGREG